MNTKAHLFSLGWIFFAAVVTAQDAKNSVAVPFRILQTGHVAPNRDYRSAVTVPRNEPLKPRVLLIHSEAELAGIWPKLQAETSSHQPQNFPGLDFDESTMVLFLAHSDSTCNGYVLSHVSESPEAITLHLIHQSPGQNCLCASEIVEPYIIVSVPRTQKTIGFEISRAARPACSSGDAHL